MAEDNKPGTAASPVKIRYETTDVSFVSQFMVNAGAEELILNLSSGYVADPNSKDNILPIHSRIAMTYGGASRLVQTLTQVLQNVSEARKAQSQSDPNTDATTATLPKFTQ